MLDVMLWLELEVPCFTSTELETMRSVHKLLVELCGGEPGHGVGVEGDKRG
jgi:hypothetical protein